MSLMFTGDEPESSLAAITSLQRKCGKAHTKLVEGTAQHTLMQNRIRALEISRALLEKALGDVSRTS